MKKFLKMLFALSIIVILLVVVLRERRVTIYRENEAKEIKAKEVSSYIDEGWFKSPVLRIYNRAGESLLIEEKEYLEYDSEVWAKEPFVAVFSDTAEELLVLESEFQDYLDKGWHEERPDHEGLEDLKAEIEKVINQYGGNWGVFVQDLETNEYLSINENRYTAASIVKIYTMATTFSEIEKGNIQKDEDIENRLRRMITESNNNDCNYLTIKNGGGNEATGFDRENELLKTLGCENTERGSYLVQLNGRKGHYRHDNYTSPRDCGRLLKAIYNKELVSEEASEEMLGLLLDQTRRWKIPAGVPEGTKVANKTGETDNVNSDVAIVFSPGGDYIICVLGMGYTAPSGLAIQKISAVTYDYFNK